MNMVGTCIPYMRSTMVVVIVVLVVVVIGIVVDGSRRTPYSAVSCSSCTARSVAAASNVGEGKHRVAPTLTHASDPMTIPKQ